MKLIKTYIKDFMASNVVNALKDAKALPIAVMGAPALGNVIGHQRLEILAKVGRTHTKTVMGAPALGDVIGHQRLEIPAKVGVHPYKNGKN